MTSHGAQPGAAAGASRRSALPSPRWRGPFRVALFAASVVGVVWAAHASGLGQALHREWIEQQIAGHGLEGYALMLLITALCAATGLPRQIPSALAGYGFGVAVGFPLALAGTTIGAIAAYLYASLVGGRAMTWPIAGRRIARGTRVLRGAPFTTILAVRLLPVGSNLATNLAAGLLRLPLIPFAAASTLGFAPQTLVFALVGKGLRVEPEWRIGLALVLAAVSAWLGQRLLRRGGVPRTADRDTGGNHAWTPSSTTGSPA